MLTVALELLLAPLLVGLATLAARRWDDGIGGLVSAFPAIVGPTLLIGAHEHGGAFAARAATGTLTGLAGLSAFALVFGRVGRRAGWPAAALGGWAAAAAAALAVAQVTAGLAAALLVAVGSLALARIALPPVRGMALAPPRVSAAARMAATLVLVAALSLAADRLGAFTGGILAALPVLASVLAVATLRAGGPAAMTELLRGMLAGMGSFVAFCAVVAAVAAPDDVLPAFALAVTAALAVQAATFAAVRARG